MKPLFILIITFALAFAASALLEIPFIAKSALRSGIVGLLIACIIFLGFLVFRHAALQEYQQTKKE